MASPLGVRTRTSMGVVLALLVVYACGGSASSTSLSHRPFEERIELTTDEQLIGVPSNYQRNRILPGGGGGGGGGGGRGGGRDGGRDGGGGGPRGGSDWNGKDGSAQQGSSGSSGRSHHHYSSSSSHSAYGDVHRRQFRHYYTSLGDVLFCLVMALAWTVWLLSSFIKSDLRKYQHESVLVRGHVLQVSVEDDSLGTGIPTYKAIIDYMVPPVREVPMHPASCSASVLPVPPHPPQRSPDEGASSGGIASSNAGVGPSAHPASSLTSELPGSIQIRKEFETSHLLTEGFANVELLVLPHEPTYSVIKEDFERDYAIHQQQQRLVYASAAAASSQNGGPHPTSLLVRSNTMGGISTLSANNNTIAHESMIDALFEDIEWWRSPWFRRLSIAGAGVLVLASVAGGIQVVTRLRPSQRCWGWVMVVVGIPLLLPAAIAIHYGLQKVRRVFESKSAMIVRGAERLAVRPCSSSCEDMMDARGGCDDEDVTIVTSPTRATAAADGCYFVRVDNHRRSKAESGTLMRQKSLPYNVQSPTKSVASCLPLASPRGDMNTALPTQVELDHESSKGETSASSVSTVSSMSMQER